jgi:hypothetical protein
MIRGAVEDPVRASPNLFEPLGKASATRLEDPFNDRRERLRRRILRM